MADPRDCFVSPPAITARASSQIHTCNTILQAQVLPSSSGPALQKRLTILTLRLPAHWREETWWREPSGRRSNPIDQPPSPLSFGNRQSCRRSNPVELQKFQII